MNSLFNFTLSAGSFGFSSVLELFCGLALFLYGMDVMGDSLKKSAGNSLKTFLGKMTTNPIKGFLLGLIVTLVIQSSSATTVMVVGFVSSGTMTLIQSVGVIIGANVGTAITAWLTALNSLGGEGGAEAVEMLSILKPDSWVPIVAVIGICLVMFTKRGRKKDMGAILLGFAVLMTGMTMMSDAVAPLKQSESFKNILTMFENPLLGILAGLILTAIVQSSSASIGILQALTVTGAITYGAAIPIVMGQNIGTCVTAMISALGANRNGKRAAVVHLSFNIIGVVAVSVIFYALNAIIGFAFTGAAINAWGVAIVHTLFKLICVVLIGPFYKQLAKLSMIIVKDSKDDQETSTLLDDRLLNTPAVAVGRATQVVATMADISTKSLRDAISLFDGFDAKLADSIRDMESKVDSFEDAIGSYLIKVSAQATDPADSEQVTKLLHIIGDYERISDHAVNIVESCEEIRDKKISFSEDAKREIAVLRSAVNEILELAYLSFIENDLDAAAKIESLEQVVDDLRDKIKLNHIIRLQKSECTIEHGFVLSDILTNFERVSDHCANIGGCVIEIAKYDALDMHKYNRKKHTTEDFEQQYKAYAAKYSV
ncbi:MAG: Na/Pi cotransporter family protein [Clostridia bacterium]|nr:Na/Pi cotransporter family protein [Clostridia bacterium]